MKTKIIGTVLLAIIWVGCLGQFTYLLLVEGRFLAEAPFDVLFGCAALLMNIRLLRRPPAGVEASTGGGGTCWRCDGTGSRNDWHPGAGSYKARCGSCNGTGWRR